MALTVCYTPTCNARALVTWLRDPDWIAHYCGHHSDARADFLVNREWVQVEDERDDWDNPPQATATDGPQTLVG